MLMTEANREDNTKKPCLSMSKKQRNAFVGSLIAFVVVIITVVIIAVFVNGGSNDEEALLAKGDANEEEGKDSTMSLKTRVGIGAALLSTLPIATMSYMAKGGGGVQQDPAPMVWKVGQMCEYRPGEGYEWQTVRINAVRKNVVWLGNPRKGNEVLGGIPANDVRLRPITPRLGESD